MAKLKFSCKTASEVLDGKEVKPSRILSEMWIQVNEGKQVTKENIKKIEQNFLAMSTEIALNEGEVCQVSSTIE